MAVKHGLFITDMNVLTKICTSNVTENVPKSLVGKNFCGLIWENGTDDEFEWQPTTSPFKSAKFKILFNYFPSLFQFFCSEFCPKSDKGTWNRFPLNWLSRKNVNRFPLFPREKKIRLKGILFCLKIEAQLSPKIYRCLKKFFLSKLKQFLQLYICAHSTYLSTI